jgi:hypothetical protein
MAFGGNDRVADDRIGAVSAYLHAILGPSKEKSRSEKNFWS